MCKDEEKKFIKDGLIDRIKNEPRVQSCNSSHLFTKENVLLLEGAVDLWLEGVVCQAGSGFTHISGHPEKEGFPKART